MRARGEPGRVPQPSARVAASRTSAWPAPRWLLLPPLLALGCAAVQGQRHYRSGTLALERGDAANAAVELEAAAAHAPGSSEVHNRLGMAYAALGRRQDAIREFERALALECGNRSAQRNLARARGEHEAQR